MSEIWQETDRQLEELDEQNLEEKQSLYENMLAEDSGGLRHDLSYYVSVKEVLPLLQYRQIYRDYLSQVKENAEHLSTIALFQRQGSFSRENVRKTADDFSRVADVEPVLERFHWVRSVLNNAGAEYLMLVYLAFFVLLFLEERKKGLWNVVHLSGGGRGKLAAKRLVALAAGTLAAFVVLYGSIVVSALVYYGPCHLDIPAQSLPELQFYPENITLRAFLFRYFVFKFFGLLLFGLGLWVLISALDSLPIAVLLAAALLAVQYAAFAFIPPQSRWNVLRYLNLCSYLFPEVLYERYLNLNFFGRAVNNREMMAALLPFLLFISAAVGVAVNVLRRPEVKRGLLSGIVERVRKGADAALCRLPGLGMEFYKSFVVQKGALILLVLLVLCLRSVPEETVYKAGTPADQQLIELEGPYDAPRATKWIQEKQKEVGTANERYERAREDAANGLLSASALLSMQYKMYGISVWEQILGELYGRIDWMRQVEQETGIKAWLINDLAYEKRLTLDFESTLTMRGLSLPVLLALSLLLSPLFPTEYLSGMNPILRGTKRGKRAIFLRKQAVVTVYVLLVFGIVYGCNLLSVIRQCGIYGLQAPVQSLSWFRNFALHIRIVDLLFLLAVFQLFTMEAIAQILLFVSSFFHKPSGAVALLVMVFVVPAVLWYIARGSLPIWNCGQLLSATEMLYGPEYKIGISNLVKYAVLFVTGSVACAGSWRREVTGHIGTPRLDRVRTR